MKKIVFDIIMAMNSIVIAEEDLFEVGRYEWTGAENIAGYILANSANHYHWAKTRIRRWIEEGRGK